MKLINLKILILVLFSFSYCSHKENIPFDSKKWAIEKDLDKYPYRDLMTEDIIDNHLFKGYEYERLIDSLGIPENVHLKKKNELYYLIENDYGWDIDPVYTKHLRLIMNKDSTIIKSEIYKWEK